MRFRCEARRIPNVSASGSYTGNDKEISSYTPATNNTWSIALQARQVLYAGGGVQSSIRSARLVREAAMFELEGVINQQLLSVRTQFYTVLLAKQRISVQEENVNLLEQQLKDAQSRFDAGTTSNFEVLRAEVALANGQPPLIQARNDYRIAGRAVAPVDRICSDRPGADVTKVPEFVGALDGGQPVTFELSGCAGCGAGQPARVAAAREAAGGRRADRQGQPRRLSAGGRSRRRL